jgi:hypothetical protein
MHNGPASISAHGTVHRPRRLVLPPQFHTVRLDGSCRRWCQTKLSARSCSHGFAGVLLLRWPPHLWDHMHVDDFLFVIVSQDRSPPFWKRNLRKLRELSQPLLEYARAVAAETGKHVAIYFGEASNRLRATIHERLRKDKSD